MKAWMMLLGAVGVLVLQALLVFGYLAASKQDPIVLNPERGQLDEIGITMVMFCGDGSGREVLDKVPPDGGLAPWTRGRTIRGDCDVWYHHSVLYHPGGD